MPELEPGAEFAGHRIEAVAGRGGMGVVYRATHLALDHTVALKVISANLLDDDRFRERFRSESRTAVSIRHPNVVAVHHAGEEAGVLFVTMDYIEGSDLREALHREGPLPPARAAWILGEVAAALDAAHARGLVHRDIKPANVLIEGSGAEERVFLTDFGLTKAAGAATSGLTATGAFVGTLDYIAPEQIRGERLDARTDVYALGCMFFEMLTGQAPFAQKVENVAKMHAHLSESPPRLASFDTSLAAALQTVIDRAMAKPPEERYPSAGDLGRAAIAASEGGAVTVAEGTVAAGAAAPIDGGTAASAAAAAGETPGRRRPTLATRPLPAGSPQDATRRRPSPSAILLALGAAALAAVVIVLVTRDGGSEGAEDPVSAGRTETQNGNGSQGDGDDPAPRFETGPPIGVGAQPVGIAAGEGAVWVANRKGRSLTVIGHDRGGETLDAEIGHRPEGIAAGLGSVWVADADTTLYEIDAEQRSVVDTFTVGPGPDGRGIALGDGKVWVANPYGDDISRIDAESGATESIGTGGAEPFGLAADEENGAVWVTNRTSGTVSRIPFGAKRADASADVGANPKGVAVEGDSVWVANSDSGTVSRVDRKTAKPRETIAVGDTPRGVTAGFGYVWVVVGLEDKVVVIDPDSGEIVDELGVPAGPDGITFGEGAVWVAAGGANQVRALTPR